MSGIYIKGMEMPKSCYVCPFCDYVSARCDAVKGNPYTPESRYEKRADFCPLVPVQPHGRLIDGDVAEAICFTNEDADGKDFYDGILYAADFISQQPTILEAEEGE